MYAIIEIGGHQYKVSESQELFVNRLENKVNDVISINRVLMVSGENGTKIGAPVLDGASVQATVIEHAKGDKLIVFKKIRRKQYQKSTGHRQLVTKIRIDKITA
jgi:large subunit ribosomal protein L21